MGAKACLAAAVVACSWGVLAASAEWRITNPRVEYLAEPFALGIDVAAPRFGWVVDPADTATAAVRGVRQEAFQLVVKGADSGEVVWDSGRIESEESRHVPFGSVGQEPAAPLASATAYDWAVTVWLSAPSNANASAPSTTVTGPATRFLTGFMDAGGWEGAEWLVAASPEAGLCRRAFTLEGAGPIKRAVLLISGLGYFQATIDGQRVTDAELEPGWTDYGRRVPYATYDVTALVSQGPREQEKVLGVSLGHGWYASAGGSEPTDVPRTLIAKLVVDGATVLATQGGAGGGWVCGQGPIVYDSIYNGETHDARRERAVAGWDRPGFDVSGQHWRPAVTNPSPPKGALVSPKMPPVRRVEALAPVHISEPQRGVFVVDFGQNIAGRVAITLPRGKGSGPRAPANVTMRHAEVLQHAGIVPEAEVQPGMIYVDNLRSARATDTFIFDDARGAEQETVVWEPAFTYHGFRYLEVRGHEPQPSELTAWVLHTDVAEVGELEFSDALLNRIQRAIHWGQRANIISVPTDCPQRDERKGWLGDAQLSGEEAMASFDMVATLVKFLHDIVDTQNEEGQIADTAPFTFGGRPADPSWGSAFPSLLYFLYRETGDLQIVREFYPAVAKYVDSVVLAAQMAGLANLYKSYGDWCNLPGTPMCSPHMTGSFSLLENLQQVSALAEALGHEVDARVYGAYHGSFTKAFHAAFYKGNGTYDNGVQTCLALALWADAAPTPELRAAVQGNLLADLVEANGYHATTGIIGMKYMLEALSHLGRADVAVTMLQQREYPSFGFMLDNELEPATTIWELWDAHMQGPGMNSRNHVMFGGPVGGWLYKHLGGVRPSDAVGPATSGYKEAVFAPPLSACMPLISAATAILTSQGRVTMSWMRPDAAPTANDTGALQAEVQVPVGGAGRIVLDGRALHAAGPLQVAVDGVSVTDTEAAPPALVEVVAREPDYVELRVPSGRWSLGVAFSVDAATLDSCNGVGAFRRPALPVPLLEEQVAVAVAA